MAVALGPVLGLMIGAAAMTAAAGPVATADRPPPVGFTLRYPPDEQVVSGAGFLHVIAEADGDIGVEIALATRPAVAVTSHAGPGGSRVFHAGVQLDPGLNVLRVSTRGSGRNVNEIRRVYYLAPLANEAVPPPRFLRRSFHASPAPTSCGRCHETRSRPEDPDPGSPRRSTCFSCHARLARAAEVHGPAAQWACTRCHDPEAVPARFATPRPPMPLCFGCHAEQQARFQGNPYQHGPTATGECTLCHDPHGTSNPFFLRKAVWDLCTTCHAEKASGRHVIAWGPTGQTHPTRGRPDPSRPGREVSCASCHNPHAAPGPKLWNFGAVLYLDLCRNCHKNVVGG